jgi:hypothetical protein
VDVRTGFWEERIATIISAKKICELGTSAVTSLLIHVPLMIEAICSSETSVFTRATWRHIPEDGILLVLNVRNYSFVLETLQKPNLFNHSNILMQHEFHRGHVSSGADVMQYCTLHPVLLVICLHYQCAG